MRANLTRFVASASELRANLAFAESVASLVNRNEGLEDESDNPLSAAAAIRSIQSTAPPTATTHKFYYTGAVVGLYAALEQYVEGLVQDAARLMSNACDDYSQLPDKLKQTHRSLTTGVLLQIQEGRYHGSLSERDLVAGLHHAIGDYMPVRLNNGVFSHHTANFRWPVIRNMFERIGIPVGTVESAEALVKAMDRLFPDAAASTQIIDDLAHRRNEASHGWQSELLSFELMQAYIEVVSAFCVALFEAVASVVAGHFVKLKGVELGRPDKVYQKHIAGYYSLAHGVAVGDVIALVTGQGVHCGRALELQRDHESVESAEAGYPASVRLALRLSPRHRLFVLPAEAQGLTSP
ncbi:MULTISPECIES: HEPN domain-containing protein [Dietzia]|uniref:HEPN domain-containing protein n=1 Tax=Dietzia TaxID=37914 RepID=UPI00101ADC77|nr:MULTISPECIES: HEPN domain-containing protein [Dietzia]MCT1712137.1 MAE_28990/MAE_18760 family HEPN-like nuclease [Dietzia cinnamea]MCT2273522.1 MAE_28990/MAE_18760 family HEPN-like nuclease [Dietzia cinnamea]